ncbi:MAG: ABC transporter permease subunit [Gammaproteobacteria bacterium]|nr:ABC transporter permease subunit [Gammaproteobacteria bacterium]MBU1629054.1 ABC transporter permease subunit [Gammaproteobacteria bacterium]MBU2546660.1 ABC transporter permease subunit [Gammaproteobacteria bacterium]
MSIKLRIWRNNQFSGWQPNLWDLFFLLIVFVFFVALAWAATQMTSPYKVGEAIPIHLSIRYLPRYALLTVLRMAVAVFFSLLFTFSMGALAAKNKHAERVLIPLVDILQSIPVLGFLSITVVAFIYLFPNSLLGPESAAIFAIFTSQAWNMFLGFYQSLKTLPHDLREASAMLKLSGWQRFWKVEVPFAMPSLIWNTMMSLSASWFFIVAAEAITVNKQTILLPGIGSYISVAISQMNKPAVLYSILAMLVVIFLYDQLIFRPLIVWSERFKSEESLDGKKAKSVFTYFLHKTRFMAVIGNFFYVLFDEFVNLRSFTRAKQLSYSAPKKTKSFSIFVFIWYAFISLLGLAFVIFLLQYIFKTLSMHELMHVLLFGVYTSLRIVVLLIICSVVWVPIGVWIGLRPRATQIVQPIAQFCASFPAYLLFPVVVMLIIRFHLNIQIWTTPLMILGTQWYILFNVIAGASALPKDLVYATKNFEVKGWLWWKRFIFPGIFPYLITGAITAAGGAWNASIVAEYVNWGHTTLIASGLGAYITQVTNLGDFPRIALGLSVMCFYVLIFNRLVWQPLYNLAEKRFSTE